MHQAKQLEETIDLSGAGDELQEPMQVDENGAAGSRQGGARAWHGVGLRVASGRLPRMTAP